MKKLMSTLIIALLTVNGFSQNLDEIIKKHIDAVGGKDNWAKVKSIKTTGSVKANGADIKIVMLQVDKKASRQDIAVMGMNGYNIITNTEGWSYMPFGGQTKPEPLTPDVVKKSQDDLSILPDFLTYKEQGKKIEYIGKDDVDGTECFKIKMTNKEKKEVTYYIDPSTYYIIKQSSKDTKDGKEYEESTSFSNYKKLDGGIVYPYNVTGGFGEMEITTIEINPKIDEALFKIAK